MRKYIISLGEDFNVNIPKYFLISSNESKIIDENYIYNKSSHTLLADVCQIKNFSFSF